MKKSLFNDTRFFQEQLCYNQMLCEVKKPAAENLPAGLLVAGIAGRQQMYI